MDISAELIGILSFGVALGGLVLALGGLVLKVQGEIRLLVERVARVEGLIEGAALFRPANAPAPGD